MASYGFHSEAEEEYLAATRHYLKSASPLIATAFVAEIEDSIRNLLASPTTWPIVEEPKSDDTCSNVFYSLDYRWEPDRDSISIYAVMHFSRRPGNWRDRLGYQK